MICQMGVNATAWISASRLRNFGRKALLLAVVSSAFLFLTGCDEGTEDEGEGPCYPRLCVDYISFRNSGEVPSNAGIVVEFTNNVFLVEISISDAAGFTFRDGNESYRAIWMPLKDLPLGDHEMTIDAEYGICKLERFTSAHFLVVGPDESPPGISDAECEPKNGATDVNPEDYLNWEWLRIGFSEPMLMARVLTVDPALDFHQNMSRNVLLFKFLKKEIPYDKIQKMPYDTKFRITLRGVDLAGNELATTEYSFTTMKKGN